LDTKADQKTIRIHGTVTSGTGEAGRITELPWVKIQFIEKLGIDPCPGTFNIEVIAGDMHKLNILRHAKSIEILPTDEHHCKGVSFPALVAGKVKGAVIIPMIPDYPPEKLEIISAENIKDSLRAKDGDLVDIEVYLP
jgi:CTP-dependent riboflavin kinase